MQLRVRVPLDPLGGDLPPDRMSREEAKENALGLIDALDEMSGDDVDIEEVLGLKTSSVVSMSPPITGESSIELPNNKWFSIIETLNEHDHESAKLLFAELLDEDVGGPNFGNRVITGEE